MVLQVVLDIGNFLNSHSSRLSSASGYTLDTLLKLPDARSLVDTSVTLLHCEKTRDPPLRSTFADILPRDRS